MAKIIERTEGYIKYDSLFSTSNFEIKNATDAISHSTACMAIDVHAKAIVVCSISGITARMVSRFRAPVDIIGMTTSEETWRKLALSWGVTPVMCEMVNSTDVLFYMANKAAKRTFGLTKGDRIVITGGITGSGGGSTNLIKLETL
jgi:pyruvate kinase